MGNTILIIRTENSENAETFCIQIIYVLNSAMFKVDRSKLEFENYSQEKNSLACKQKFTSVQII